MAAPKKVDYERIEAGWRAGIKSPAQLAADYTSETGVSVSAAAIRKHFEKHGVTRDLTQKVMAKADSMVLDAMVSKKVSPETLKRESEIVEAGARVIADVRITHRSDIIRFRNLAIRLLDELENVTDHVPELEDLGVLLRSEDEKGIDKLNDIYQKVIAMPNRVDAIKKLSETLRILIGLEREAYGMKAQDKGDEFNELANRMEEARRRAANVG